MYYNKGNFCNNSSCSELVVKEKAKFLVQVFQEMIASSQGNKICCLKMKQNHSPRNANHPERGYRNQKMIVFEASSKSLEKDIIIG